jgi:hypothetical protein
MKGSNKRKRRGERLGKGRRRKKKENRKSDFLKEKNKVQKELLLLNCFRNEPF